MTTFNTGNPIGSTDSRDRLDNTENMDYLENSTTELTHPDRLGTVRKTRHGMEAEHDNQISAHEVEHAAQIAAHEVEHDNQMQSFETDFDGRLAGMAFTRVGSFTAGATLIDMRQVLVWEASQGGDGHEYGWTGSFSPSGKVVIAGSNPETTGGIGAGAWVDRTDVTLRDEIRETVFQNIKRSYSEAGLNMVDGSFEAGGTLVNANDVLLQERTGKAFSGPAGTVVAGTNPASGGFVDRSGVLLLNRVQGKATGIWGYSYAAGETITSTIGAQYCNIAGKNFGQPGLSGSVDLINSNGDFAKISDIELRGDGSNLGVFSAGVTRWASTDTVTFRNFARAFECSSMQYCDNRNLRFYGNDVCISIGGTSGQWSGANTFTHTHISAQNGTGIAITTPLTTIFKFIQTIIEGTNKAITTKGNVRFDGLYVGDQIVSPTRPEVPSAIDSDGATLTINDGEIGITSFQTTTRKTVFDIKNAGRVVVNNSDLSLNTQMNVGLSYFPVDVVSFDSTDCKLELNNVRFKRSVNGVHSIAPFKLTSRAILRSRENILNYVIDGTFQPSGYISGLTSGTLLPVNLGFVNQFGGGVVRLTKFYYAFTYEIPAAFVGKQMCLEVWYLKGINNNGRYVDFANSDFVEKPEKVHFSGMSGGLEVDMPSPQKYIVTPTNTRGVIRISTNDIGDGTTSEVYLTSVILKRRSFEDCLDYVEDVKSVLN